MSPLSLHHAKTREGGDGACDAEVRARDRGGVQGDGGCKEPMASDNAGCAEAVPTEAGKGVRRGGRHKAPYKPQEPTARHYAVAQNLINGMTTGKAMMAAGYSRNYARVKGHKFIKSQQVVQALLEIERNIPAGQLGKLAKARLHEKLVKMPKGDKDQLAVIRTAAEMDGLLGGPSELHLHQHATLPPTVQKMLEDKMREILTLKEGAVDGTIVSEGAESPDEDQKDHDGVQVGDAA